MWFNNAARDTVYWFLRHGTQRKSVAKLSCALLLIRKPTSQKQSRKWKPINTRLHFQFGVALSFVGLKLSPIRLLVPLYVKTNDKHYWKTAGQEKCTMWLIPTSTSLLSAPLERNGSTLHFLNLSMTQELCWGSILFIQICGCCQLSPILKILWIKKTWFKRCHLKFVQFCLKMFFVTRIEYCCHLCTCR